MGLGDGLAFLATDALADDADALPLVGLGRIIAAHFGRNGADDWPDLGRMDYVQLFVALDFFH